MVEQKCDIRQDKSKTYMRENVSRKLGTNEHGDDGEEGGLEGRTQIAG